MVNYKCPRCGYEINIKTKYVNHLRRKKLCNPVLSEDDLQNEYIKFNITEKILSNKNQTIIKHNGCGYQTKIKQKSNKNNSKSDIYECKYCEKQFKYNQSFYRHLKTCKKKKEDDEEKQNLLNLVNTLNKQLEKRDKQIEEQNNQINELIKKAGINIGTQNIQQNIQQNIKILAYNNTDLSHLTDKDYLKCLKHSNFCIPHLIKKIHFNPKKPENHNIYISNLKNNYVMIYNGNKWMINDREESIQNLIDEKESIIEQKLEEWIENGEQYPDIMKKFNRYLEKRENDKVLNKIKSEIKMMLFNNRDIVSTK
jgi:hypothetical protein